MSQLELHCDLAYLEYILERVIWKQCNDILQAGFSSMANSNGGRIDCKFVPNKDNTYDLHIYSKLPLKFDFKNFMDTVCNLNKKEIVYYDKVDNYEDIMTPTFTMNTYIKSSIFKDITEKEVEVLIGYFNILQFEGINFNKVSDNLVRYNKNYNFNKIFLRHMNWENDLEEAGLVYRDIDDNITIYIKDPVKALMAWDWLLFKCPELSNYMTKVDKIPEGHNVLWAHKYNYWFVLNLNKRQYLGLCHILTDKKEI